MADSRPVGVFDSGYGGVSFLREAIVRLPDENFVYYGDNAHAPYGLKSPQEILERSMHAARFLQQRGAKMLVVACNTATSAAINEIRRVLDLTVVSMEPAIKPALEHAGTGSIIMLATPATCAQDRYLQLKQRLDTDGRVIDVGGRGIVERVEQGIFGEGAYDDLLHELLGDYEGREIDGIVLGCTHYPFIAEEIARYAQAHFTGRREIFDGGAGTAQQLSRLLHEQGLASGGPGGGVEFFSSAGEAALPTLEMLLRK